MKARSLLISRRGDASPKTDSTDPVMQAQGANKYGIGENNNETAF